MDTPAQENAPIRKSKIQAYWTPERRAAQSRRMKKLHKVKPAWKSGPSINKKNLSMSRRMATSVGLRWVRKISEETRRGYATRSLKENNTVLARELKVHPSIFSNWRKKYFGSSKKYNNGGSTNGVNGHGNATAIVRTENSEQIRRPEIDIEFQNQIAYCVGSIREKLTIYANGVEVSPRLLTRRVAELLLRS